MKKHLALLLAAAMVLTTVPATAFAGSSNRVSRVEVTEVDELIKGTSLIVENKDSDWKNEKQEFVLTLQNAKWTKDVASKLEATDGNSKVGETTVSRLTDREIAVTVENSWAGKEKLFFNLKDVVEATDEGDATITLDARDSELSSGTYTFAKVTKGSTVTTIEKKTDITETAVVIKPIVIDESVAGTFKKGEVIKLRLAGEFEFASTNLSVSDIAGVFTDSTVAYGKDAAGKDDKRTLEITLNDAEAAGRSKISLDNIKVYATDDAKVGDIAEITVSGAGVDKTTLEVGQYVDFGVNFTVEDKELPVIYSGAAYDVDDTETLKVTIKESVANSWIANRKAEIIFPKEVKVNSVDFKKVDNTDFVKKEYTAETDTKLIDKNKVKLTGFEVTDEDKKVELELVFNVSVEPGFTGDITATLSGAGVGDDQTLTVAKAEMPFTVETKTNELKIDYRHTKINDIVIKEAYAGAFEKGTTLRLETPYLDFEKGFEYEVVAGDLKVDEVVDNKGGLDITIDRESVKAPAEIKISNLSLYMDRALAAGDYELTVVPFGTDRAKDAFFQNYDKEEDIINGKTQSFDTDEVVLMKDFVKVITSGRDNDDATFTKQLKVTIGAETMTAGKEEINLKGAIAYISENGYTMLPVRAVAEALSDVATVNWDAATRRVTVIFGSRIIGMTIGSNEMVINGTTVPMSAKAVIKNDWTYIPLRDLGYALGLGDDKIAWDDATKTATLN